MRWYVYLQFETFIQINHVYYIYIVIYLYLFIVVSSDNVVNNQKIGKDICDSRIKITRPFLIYTIIYYF